MFIHELTETECRQVLARASFGRLACARDEQPYVVPISLALDGSCLYGFTTSGQKIEWMRSNPKVCFETDEVVSESEWTSVVVFGRYEELTDTPEHESARAEALELLQRRPMWWEPGYIGEEHRDQPHSLTPIFFRIHIDKMTGHRSTADGDETPLSETDVPTSKCGWAKRLLHLPF